MQNQLQFDAELHRLQHDHVFDTRLARRQKRFIPAQWAC